MSSMAIRHRKLYPTSATNQTGNCQEYCDPTICPYGCNPYSDVDFMPPPLPPQAGPLSAKGGHHISPYVIIIMALLASFFLFVGYYFIILKYCRRRNSLRRSPTQSDGDQEFADENHGPMIDHPIWYINTVGLQPSVINSIGIFKYKKGDSFIEGTECSVCLNEFQEDESLRLLPKCNHAFHIHCIDTWLRSHTNCPLCRAGIIFNTLNDQNSNNLSLNEDTQIEILDTGGELDDYQTRDGEVCDNRPGGGEDQAEFLQENEEAKDATSSKTSVNTILNSLLRVGGDSTTVVIEDMQPMRRSVSLDFLPASAPNIGLIDDKTCAVGRDVARNHVARYCWRSPRMIRMVGESPIEQCLHTKPVSMKRSASCGGTALFTRHYRSLGTILPM